MFAPVFHPAMKYAAAPRREIGIRTVFNILGPLTNPAVPRPRCSASPTRRWPRRWRMVLQPAGLPPALVVHGEDGMDEISITRPDPWSAEVKDGDDPMLHHTPGGLGLDRGPTWKAFGAARQRTMRRWLRRYWRAPRARGAMSC